MAASRWSPLRRFFHPALAFVVVWVQTAVTLLAAAQTPVATGERSEAERAVAFLRGLRQYRAALDATRFDPRALGESFGADWRAAFRFLRDEIALHPYRGTLRFAEGTLVSRAGNACDRALLLADLLEAGGHPVRFARARLDEATARRLLATVDRPRATASRPVATDAFDPELLRALAPAGLGETAYRTALEESTAVVRNLAAGVASDTGFVRDSLTAALGDDRPPPAAPPDVLAALADHCWVQMRTGDGWIDLDPSLPELAPGDRLAAAETVSDTLAPELAPSLAFRLELLREEDGELRRQTVLDTTLAVERAVETVSLLLMPELERQQRLIGPVLAGEYGDGFDTFVPVLVTDGDARVGEPFGPDGRVVAKDMNARVATGAGETLGGLFGGALGALQQALDEAPAGTSGKSRFAGIELFLDLRLPDGSVRSERRLLVPPMPEEDLRRLLPRTTDLLITASRISRELFLARTLDALAAARPLVRATLREENPDRFERTVAGMRLMPLQLLEFAHLRSVFAEYLAAEAYPDLLALPAEPLVVAYRRETVRRGGEAVVSRGFDLVFRRLSVVPREAGAGTPAEMREFASLLAILDNVLEHRLAGSGAVRSGVAMLAGARREGIALELLRSGRDLARLAEVPAYARGLMEEALRAGYWVVAPARPIPRADGPLFAFWRLDPGSGQMLAIGADGAGQALAEYSQQIKLVALGTLVSCVVTGALGQFASMGEFASCLLLGIVIGVVTMGAVGWLANKLGWMTPAGQAMTEGAIGGVLGAAGGRLTGGGGAPNPPPGRASGGSRPASQGGQRNLSGALSEGRMAQGVAPHGGSGQPASRGTGAGSARGAALSAEAPAVSRPGRGRPSGGRDSAGASSGPRSGLDRLAAVQKGTGGSTAGGSASSPGLRGARTAGDTSEAPSKTAEAPGGKPRGEPARKPGDTSGEEPKRLPSELHGQEFEMATPTPKPPSPDEEIPPSMRRIEHFEPLVEAIEATNLGMTDIGDLKSSARSHRKILITRKVNPHARRWYKQGAVGKDINMKGKSANRGAIAGLIPEDQAFSKLYDAVLGARTPEERAAAWNRIAEYNAKVREAVEKGGYEFVPFEVEGRKVGIYKRGDKVYQAYEKGGVLYDAATRKPIGDPGGFRRIKDLRVVGKRVDGESRYVTADIDLDYVIENPHAPEQRTIKWKPETGDTLGNRTPRQEALLKGLRNIAEAGGDTPKVLHGAEQLNPYPEKLTISEFPKLVVFEDGSLAVLRNPYDQWKLLRDLKARGYRIELSEEIRKAYDWPENWWEKPPEAVREWAPKTGDRPRRRRPRRPSRRPLARRLPLAA